MQREPDVLRHVRVLELDGDITTSYAGRALADLGAQVTRVEAGASPDSLRRRGIDGARATPGALFSVLNHGKELVAVEGDVLTAPRFRDLVGQADILLAGRHTVSDADVQTLRRHNPRLVIGIASMCGERHGDRRWMHLHAAALSGVTALIGHPDRSPLPPPFDLGQYPAGVQLAGAVLAALFDAREHDHAQVVQVDVAAVLFSFMWTAVRISAVSSGRFTRNGRRFPGSGGAYPFGLFPCADGYVALIGRSAGDWRILLGMMGSPAWAQDDHFQDPVEIARNWADEADAQLSPWLKEHSRSELFGLARQSGFPLAPVNRVLEVLQEPQFEARGSIGSVPDVGGQQVRLLRYPYHFAEASPTAPGNAGRGHTGPDEAKGEEVRRPPAGRDRLRPILSGLRVLDLSWVWSGPMVGAAFADLGADVIKLENPSRLDNARLRGRPIVDGKPMPGPIVELSTYFHQNNRGKRSMLLDIKDPAGADAFRRLVRVSDIIVENLTPGVFDRAGLGYRDVVADNPRLIWLAASAVGSTGPLLGLRAYAPIMSSLGGLEGLVGYEDDPVVGMLGFGLGDANAGSHALFAVLAALVARQRDGLGRFIDLSQIETAAAVLIEPLVEAQLRRSEVATTGCSHPNVAPHNHYRCAGDDQWVAIAAVDDAMWGRLARIVGGSRLAEDPHFATAADRVARRAELDALIANWTSTQSREAVVTCMAVSDIAAMPIFEVAEARGMFGGYLDDVEHPVTGPETLVRVPWLLSETPAATTASAPTVGQHTDEILRDLLGMDEVERRQYMARFGTVSDSA